MKRIVAIYARVSTEHEAQLSALENQVQYYDDILAKHPDWELYDRYIDEGITGTSIKKRKNFLRMMEDAKNGCFDLIITREVSRFARNTVDTLQETRNLKKIGVEVYFTEDNIWTFNDEDGELKLTIMATLAQNESKKTSQRVKAGQKISFENGVFYGTGNVLGYDKVGKDMIVNEEQAEIVRFIFSSFLDGMGSTAIKYELEKRGCLTSTGLKNWSASYITRILKNPFYCGTIVYRKSFVPDFLEQKAIINKGDVEQIIVEGRHQPLISKEDFQRVQELFKVRSAHIPEKKKAGYGNPKSIWSKKLVCNCGSTYNKRIYHKKNEETTFCYQCYKQKNMGTARARQKRGLEIDGACDTPIVQEWKLNLTANVLFNMIWEDKESIIDMANKMIDENIKEEDHNNEIDNIIKSNLNKIESNNRKAEKLLEMYLSGDMIKKEEYIKKKTEIEEVITKLKKENEELEQKRNIPKETLLDRIKKLKNCIKKILNWDDENVSDEIVESFVDKIIVLNEGFVWKLNYINDIIEVDIKGRSNSSSSNLFINGKLLPEFDCGTSRNQGKRE